MLNRLSKIDKHHALLVQMVFPYRDTIEGVVSWNPEAVELERERRDTIGPLSGEDETELFRVRFSPEGPDPQVRVDGPLTVLPTFGDNTWQTPLATIKDIRDLVISIVASLEVFL